MYSKNELEKIIKKKIEENQLIEASEIVKLEIKQIFVSKIKKYENDYKYTDIINLGVKIKKYLPLKFFSIYKKYCVLMNEDEHPLYELQRLIELYNQLGKE